TEQIWRDDGNASNNNANTVRVGTHSFDLLYQGVDYSIDYTTGVIVFNSGIFSQSTIAVAFEYGDGTRVTFGSDETRAGRLQDEDPAHLVSNWDISVSWWADTNTQAHLIYDGSPNGTGQGDAHMVTNWYQLGYRNIVPKEFDPDFTIRILDASNNEVTGLVEPVFDSDFYDFGILKLRGAAGRGLGVCDPPVPSPRPQYSLLACPALCGPPASEQPFAYDPANRLYCRGDNAYMYGSVTTRSLKYRIKMHFHTRVLSYRLKNISIVRGSERIAMDGRPLTRDVDYFIDYDFGQITFLRPDQIRYDSRIQIDYEYLPFGGQFQSFLWGTRAQYTISDKAAVGGTFLSNNSQSPQDAPSPSAAPKTTTIAGVDGRTFLSRRELSNFLQVLPGFETSVMPLEMEIRGEVARSDINPNSFTQAFTQGGSETGIGMIDAMEGVDDVIEASVDAAAWFPSPQPVWPIPLNRTERLAWHTSDGGHQPATITRSLELQYQNLSATSWDGLRYVLSPVGLDLSNFQYLEMWVYGDGNNEQLAVSLGVVSEDSNGNNALDTEDLNRDFALNGGEDVGIPPGGAYWGGDALFPYFSRWVAPGAKVLNTEDANGNGSMDAINKYFEYRVTVDWT
ncbi:MAG: hypothetical protein AAB368_00185, partial [bacterium]